MENGLSDYVVPLGTASAEKAKERAVRRALQNGADAVVNAGIYRETHMILLLIGWKEYHFNGEAISYVKGENKS